MLDTTIVAPNGAEPPGTAGDRRAFTYCCECGTYDAHASRCNCCGFDFTGETAADADETE